tara:strand:+ start:4805 stop:4960 length:156 start_codon:yes stop_codon:yes gene_type:complete
MVKEGVGLSGKYQFALIIGFFVVLGFVIISFSISEGKVENDGLANMFGDGG